MIHGGFAQRSRFAKAGFAICDFNKWVKASPYVAHRRAHRRAHFRWYDGWNSTCGRSRLREIKGWKCPSPSARRELSILVDAMPRWISRWRARSSSVPVIIVISFRAVYISYHSFFVPLRARLRSFPHENLGRTAAFTFQQKQCLPRKVVSRSRLGRLSSERRQALSFR